MKRTFSLMLALVLCLSLCACGAREESSTTEPTPASIVVDGEEVSVKGFLVEHLSEYIQSEAYLAREAAFEELFGTEAGSFAVTKVIELTAEGLGPNSISVHYLAVKADCDFAVDDCGFDNILLVVDYESGKVYDEFTIDPSWETMDGSNEQQIWYMLHGPLVGSDYDGGAIIIDSEVRTELSVADIAEINAELNK